MRPTKDPQSGLGLLVIVAIGLMLVSLWLKGCVYVEGSDTDGLPYGYTRVYRAGPDWFCYDGPSAWAWDKSSQASYEWTIVYVFDDPFDDYTEICLSHLDAFR